MCFLDVSHQIDGVVSSRRLFSPPIPSEKMNIQRFTISAKWETPLQIRYIFRPSQSNKQQQVLLIGSKTSCIYATSIYILKTTSCEVNSHFSEILNPWVHTSEYALVCCAFGNVYYPGHPKVTISYFASFYLSHSISSISYFSFSGDFFSNLLFCTFCNFSGE